MMVSEGSSDVQNIIRGGLFQAPVLMGRDIQATFQVPAAAPMALAQLPPPAAGFTGRDEELSVLANLLDPAGSAGVAVVSAVAGLAGVGKTALAVEAGHTALARGWFAGGVLFIDLHGYDDQLVEPRQALGALLRALAVPAEHLPPTVEERAGLYRSILHQIPGPVLVIADNASSEAQVRPLLPGSRRHRVLVSSRHTLAGLGARLVDVTVLGEAVALDLLGTALQMARPDDDRITGDRKGALRLVRKCGGLPLALQITAALLRADPALRAAELADQLSDEKLLLQALRYDDGSGTSAPSVAGAFELSYRRLDAVAARMFRLLPVHPGLEVSTAAAAVIAELPETEARAVLAKLVHAHLVEPAPGAAGQWRMHDLLHLYARRLSDDHAEVDGREEAQNRLRLLELTPYSGGADPDSRTAAFSITEALEGLGTSYRARAVAAWYRARWAASRRHAEVAVLEAHAGVGSICAVEIDGRQLLASAGGDGTVKIWDPATRELQRELRGHVGSVLAVCAFEVAGERKLASAGNDRTLRIWDPATGKLWRTLRGHTGKVLSVCPVQAGGMQMLASTGADGTIQIWDAATGERRHIIAAHK